MFREGSKLIIETIERLQKIAPVDVLIVPGNHDKLSIFFLGEILDIYYKNNQNVTVDTSLLPRKYYKYGTNLISLSHNIKVKDALKLVSTEGKDNWSSCNHVYCICALVRNDYFLLHFTLADVFFQEKYLSKNPDYSFNVVVRLVFIDSAS